MRISRFTALAAFAALPALAQAQVSTSVQATATVVTPLAITGAAPLAFGSVFQSVPKTVSATDASSGRFGITGSNASQVALTFTLPANLTATGGLNLPIDTWDVRTNGTNNTGGATTLAVTSGTPVNTNLVLGNLFVFVGGRVVPSASQAAGSYAGTVVLAAAYTGL